MRRKETRSNCPIAAVVEVIGSKCKIMVLYRLQKRAWRFNELQRDIGEVSPKVLTENLRALEADGLITRTVFSLKPLHVEYALSELGRSMEPLLHEMHTWGAYYLRQIGLPL